MFHKSLNSLKLRILMFVAPLGIWLAAFKEFFTKHALIDLDTYTIYAITRYLFANLKTGFPDWNPYSLWGMGHLRQMGEFNPLLYLIPALDFLGLDFYQAFLVFMVLTFFLGALGVYYLTRTALEDTGAAYAAYLMFLLSSICMLMFIQVTYILIFVPAIWFFAFLLKFFKTYRHSYFYLLTFTLIMIMTTYIPFYFLTSFLAFLALFVIFYFKSFLRCAAGLFEFSKKNALLVLFSFLAVALAVYPSFKTWLSLKTVFTPLARPATLTYAIVRNGGIPVNEILRDYSVFSLLIHSFGLEMLSYSRELFSLNNVPYDNHRLFTIPLFAHLTLTTTLLTKAGRRLVFLCSLCVVMFLLAVVNLTPIYEFLFENVFYFRMYRNVFLLLAVLIVVYILLAGEQLSLFCRQVPATIKGKILCSLTVLLVHVAWFVFLMGQPNVLSSSYFTIAGSCAFFILICCGLLRLNSAAGLSLVLVLVFIQPWEVVTRFVSNSQEKRSQLIAESIDKQPQAMSFSYTRPELNHNKVRAMSDKDIYRRFFADLVEMKDSPGFLTDRYGYPTVWTAQLEKKIPYLALKTYIKNKFIVYDSLRFVDDATLDFRQLAEDLNRLKNEAYVSKPVSGPDQVKAMNMLDEALKGRYPHADVITGDGAKLTMLAFAPNRVSFKTNFKTDKFLVYNDSFAPMWKASLNGKETSLFRANYAFKGVLIPAGEHIVEFVYGSKEDKFILPLLLLVSVTFLGAGLLTHIREGKAK